MVENYRPTPKHKPQDNREPGTEDMLDRLSRNYKNLSYAEKEKIRNQGKTRIQRFWSRLKWDFTGEK